MNHSHLRSLLERYEAAETSLAEERELKQLLAAPDLPAEFAADAAYFGVQHTIAGMRAAPPEALPAGPWQQPPQLRTVHRRRLLKVVYAAAAAVILVALGIGLFLHAEQSTDPTAPIAQATAIDWSKYEITDPAEATRITSAALATVTHSIDRSGRITSREVSRIEPIHQVLKL